MRRTSIAALTVAAALAACPASSLAASADGGTPQTSRTAIPGAGKATSAADANGATGALRVSGQATGGRSLLALPLPGNGSDRDRGRRRERLALLRGDRRHLPGHHHPQRCEPDPSHARGR